MSITYAGVPLDTPDPAGDLQAVLERYWHERRIGEAEHPAYVVTHGLSHLPVPAPPGRECPRLGVLHWPVGLASRWATFHALVAAETLAAVRAAVGGTPAAAALVVSDGSGSVSPDMWMLPPRPVCQKGGKELYLLSLVDERWFWWLHGDQKAPPAPATWPALLSALFASVGLSPSLPTIPAAYGTPDPDRWGVGYKPVPLLIDAACATVGLRVVRGTDGTVTVQTAAAANNADASRWADNQSECLTGGRLTAADVARGLPASVAVIFPAKDPSTSEKVTKTLAGLAIDAYAGAAAVPGAFAQVNADLPAGSSAAAEDAYATQAATDYYLWALSQTDATFRGVVPWAPTGQEDAVEWVHEPDRVLTRVVRGPFADLSVYGNKDEAECCEWGAGSYAFAFDETSPAVSLPIPTADGSGNLTAQAYRLLRNTIVRVPAGVGAFTLKASVCLYATWVKTDPPYNNPAGQFQWFTVGVGLVRARSPFDLPGYGDSAAQPFTAGGAHATVTPAVPALSGQRFWFLHPVNAGGPANGTEIRYAVTGDLYGTFGTQSVVDPGGGGYIGAVGVDTPSEFGRVTTFRVHYAARDRDLLDGDRWFALCLLTAGGLTETANGPHIWAVNYSAGNESDPLPLYSNNITTPQATYLIWERACCDPDPNVNGDGTWIGVTPPPPTVPPPPPPPTTFTVNPTGTPAPRPQTYPVGTTVVFAANPVGGAAPISYAWDAGDGVATAGSETPSHTFSVAGKWTMAVVARDANGAVATGSVGVYLIADSPVKTVTTNYTIPDDVSVTGVRADTTAGGITVTLPDVTLWPAEAEVEVWNVGGTGNTLTVSAAGGQTIGTIAGSRTAVTQDSFFRLRPSGVAGNWLVTAKG